jgi:hypothetical protein
MRELIDREDALDAIKFAELGREYDEVEKVQIFNPWHKVEEELPPKATWVLTVATDGNVKLFNIATVDAGGQWWTCSPQNILRELYGVRYWMPIEPPKEDE